MPANCRSGARVSRPNWPIAGVSLAASSADGRSNWPTTCRYGSSISATQSRRTTKVTATSLSTSRQSTYNRLNRLIVRLLRDPQILAPVRDVTPDIGKSVDVRLELETLADEISGRGIDNPWSALDMALLNILLARQDAATAYAPFERMGAPDFACQSALDVVAPLAELDLPVGPELRCAEQRLRRAKGVT